MRDGFCWFAVLLRSVMASLGSSSGCGWAPGARLNSAARGSGVSGPAAAAKEEAAHHDGPTIPQPVAAPPPCWLTETDRRRLARSRGDCGGRGWNGGACRAQRGRELGAGLRPDVLPGRLDDRLRTDADPAEPRRPRAHDLVPYVGLLGARPRGGRRADR